MIIAVSYENGEVFQHFGHSEYFKLYQVADGIVTQSDVRGTEGSGHEALADWLKGQGADVVICGGIGDGARQALRQADIRVFGGAAGQADDAVQALLCGTLDYDPAACCTHHGEHGCGGCHGGGCHGGGCH